MTDTLLKRFVAELDTFFVLVLLNITFGALAMATGMQYIFGAVAGTATLLPAALPQPAGAAVAMISFGLGLCWLIAGARILRGITAIRREYRHHSGQIPPEILTCWIVRLMAHYRTNRAAICWMIPVCGAGGIVFLILGTENLLQGFAAGFGFFPFLAAAINLTIGSSGLASALIFRQYAARWDERSDMVSGSEDTLQHALEQR